MQLYIEDPTPGKLSGYTEQRRADHDEPLKETGKLIGDAMDTMYFDPARGMIPVPGGSLKTRLERVLEELGFEDASNWADLIIKAQEAQLEHHLRSGGRR